MLLTARSMLQISATPILLTRTAGVQKTWCITCPGFDLTSATKRCHATAVFEMLRSVGTCAHVHHGQVCANHRGHTHRRGPDRFYKRVKGRRQTLLALPKYEIR